MNQTTSSNKALVLGGFLSVLLHLAGGVAVAWRIEHSPAKAAEAAGPEPQAAAEERSVALGLERSRNVTINWIGFEQATEHLAPQADIEQPELTMDPAGGGAPATRPTATQEAQTPALEPASAPATAMSVAPPAGITEPGEEPPPTEAAAPSVAVRPTPSEATPRPAEAQTTPAEPPPLSPQEVVLPTPSEQPGETRSPGAGRGEAPGEAAEKESSATALAQTLEVRPGRPAATEGLEINTVRPRWRNTTLLTAHPRNPTVWITFGRDGKVKRAGFVKEGKRVLNSGYAEVDEPLMNAVYRWTAKGEALADIPASPEETPADEQPGITVKIRVVLLG